MMSSMLGGGGVGGGTGMGDLGGALPMMFMMGGGSFDGMFDFDEGDDDNDADADDDEDGDGFLGKLLGEEDEKAEPEKAREV